MLMLSWSWEAVIGIPLSNTAIQLFWCCVLLMTFLIFCHSTDCLFLFFLLFTVLQPHGEGTTARTVNENVAKRFLQLLQRSIFTKLGKNSSLVTPVVLSSIPAEVSECFAIVSSICREQKQHWRAVPTKFPTTSCKIVKKMRNYEYRRYWVFPPQVHYRVVQSNTEYK